EEQPEHEAELENEVRRRELERHRGNETRPPREERLRDRDRRVRARRRRGPERRRKRDLAKPPPAERALEALARNPGLDDPGEREPEHERPPDLPEHLAGMRQPVDDPHTPLGYMRCRRQDQFGR